MDPNKTDTQSIARNHIIEVSQSDLLTIAGGKQFCFLIYRDYIFLPLTPPGKWTTYRSMAEELVNKAVTVGGLTDTRGCVTDGYTLEGGDGWFPTAFIRLVQDYGIDVDVSGDAYNTIVEIQ